MLWFSHFWMGLSVSFLELGVYITEQLQFSYNNGATFGLLGFEALFWFGVVASKELFPSKYSSSSMLAYNLRSSRAILIVVAVSITMLYLNLALTGAPLLSDGITRFNYWSVSALPFLNVILGDVATPLIFMLSVVFSIAHVENKKKHARVAALLFFSLILYYYLMGQKFSIQFFALSVFFGTALYMRKIRGLKTEIGFFQFFLAFLFVVFAIVILVGNYTSSHSDFVEGQGGVLFAVIYRALALQGHVWWGAYDIHLNPAYVGGHGNSFSLNGMETMMYAVSPAVLVQDYLSQGVRFTMAYPAIVLYKYGFFWGGVLQFIAGYCMGFVVSVFAKMIAQSRIYASCASLIVLEMLIIMFNMGDFSDLLKAKFLLPLLAFIFLVLCFNNFRGKFGFTGR
jgi:hypothetical protein